MQQFRIASKIEEDQILSLYDAVKAKGKIDGTSDWDEDYPNREILKDDLKNSSLYVLQDNNKIVAAISMVDEESPELQLLDWAKVKSCFLVRLCVAPEYQSKGIGEKMMHYISDTARERGFKATHHLAAEVNEAANRLYKRMGYRNLGRIHVYGTDFIAYEMIL